MSKLLILYFILLSFLSVAQHATSDQKLLRNLDPEVLWYQTDSLNNVDTTTVGMDLAAYYNLRFRCDQLLHWFDHQEYHLMNCLKWVSGEYFHQTSLESLICGLETCQKLDDRSKGDYYYRLILATSAERNWTSAQKRRIHDAASRLRLIAYDKNEELPYFDYPTEHVCCEMDTLVKMHSNISIIKNAETYRHYELVKGEKNCLEITMNTKNCRCSDAGYSSKFFIELNDTLLPQTMELSSQNLFCSVQNVWIADATEDIQHGKLFHNEYGIYLIFVVKRNADDEHGIFQTHWIAQEYLEEIK